MKTTSVATDLFTKPKLTGLSPAVQSKQTNKNLTRKDIVQLKLK